MENEIEQYLQTRGTVGRYWEKITTNPITGAIELKGKHYPTTSTIALMCGVSLQTFLTHVKAKNKDGTLKNQRLNDVYKMFTDLCQLRLIEGGACGAYAPSYVQFIGNVNYRMIPKQQVEQTVEITAIDKRFAELDEIYKTELDRIEQQKAEMAKRKAELDKMEMN